jgi:Fe2+ or Zn2+ uptake regulation protein
MAQLQDLFQTHAIVKIIDFLTLYKDFEYTKTDIARETEISRRTLYEVWPTLEKFKLAKKTRSAGQITFYKLNQKNPMVKHLVRLVDEVSLFMAEKIAAQEIGQINYEMLESPADTTVPKQGEIILEEEITTKEVTKKVRRVVHVRATPTYTKAEIEKIHVS